MLSLYFLMRERTLPPTFLKGNAVPLILDDVKEEQ